MTQNIEIRRRPDGSINIDFYARRALFLRGTVLRNEPARWFRELGRFITTLVRAARIVRPN
jgi:hypothetical protein